MAEPVLMEIKTGWAAVGDGWAVRAPDREQAVEKFREAERRHAEIDARPFFYERLRADAGRGSDDG
jgi:hypothetical protein